MDSRLYPDSSPQAFNAPFDDRQPNARTGINLHTMQPLKRPKNSRLMVRINPNSVVCDPKSYPLRGLGSRGLGLRGLGS